MAIATPYSETTLLAQIAKGDEKAFEIIFSTYRHKLYVYLLHHVKSKQIAEEIVTDIFMKLWTGRALATHITDLGAFLHKVGHYKALDFLKTAARHERLGKIYSNRMQMDTQQTPADLIIDAEAKALLDAAIQQLPPRRKLIYQLSREAGLTHEQIAQALNLSRATVNNALVASNRSIVKYLRDHRGGKVAFSIFFFLS